MRHRATLASTFVFFLMIYLLPSPVFSQTEWTPWLNRDSPGGSGDYETLNDFLKEGKACPAPSGIECQTQDGRNWTETGQVYSCAPDKGGLCKNSDQQGGGGCLDYRVRFRCPQALSRLVVRLECELRPKEEKEIQARTERELFQKLDRYLRQSIQVQNTSNASLNRRVKCKIIITF